MNSVSSFQELGIFPQLGEKLQSLSITEPTKVQQQTIPLLVQGSSLIFQSETGTGKTFAYLLPLLQKIDTSVQQIQLIIVAPTHELASQIKAQIQLVTDLTVALLIGGAPIKRQIELLKNKPYIVVGGSARLMELVYLKKMKVHQVKALVLDEADRLLSPELRDETSSLCQALPTEIQLVACSATINNKTERLINNLLPYKKNAQEEENTCETKNLAIEKRILPPEDVLQQKITHIAIYSESRDKIDTLRKLLVAEQESPNTQIKFKAIIFTARPAEVEIIQSKLSYKKINSLALHAKQDKVKRKQALDQFRKGNCPILITSDLAARGLDIPDVSHIIQMDMPSNVDFFIHRAGRTGRNGKSGLNIVIGDGYEMRQLATTEKKLKLTVYPKILYKGKMVAPKEGN